MAVKKLTVAACASGVQAFMHAYFALTVNCKLLP